jgi:sugar/nucleoside kinase (ribokinase family)
MPLIVTGTVGIDTINAPTGHVEGVLGGSCTYFAAAASFYDKVRVVAVVGDDFPKDHFQTLAKFRNVDTAGLEIRRGSKTFRWGGRYLENMNQRETLFTELGVLLEAPPVVPSAYEDSRFVFLANTHPAVQMKLLSTFSRPSLVVADTMDLWINTARPELEALMAKLDGLVLNYDEAELMTGKRNPVTAARRIIQMGPKFVVVKKGEHGCLFVHKDGMGALPAYPAEEVVDPTGAGDTFAGGMMGHIAAACGRDAAADPKSIDVLRRALAHGTVMASFNIESFSLDRLTRLTSSELSWRYDEYARMLRIH